MSTEPLSDPLARLIMRHLWLKNDADPIICDSQPTGLNSSSSSVPGYGILTAELAMPNTTKNAGDCIRWSGSGRGHLGWLRRLMHLRPGVHGRATTCAEE